MCQRNVEMAKNYIWNLFDGTSLFKNSASIYAEEYLADANKLIDYKSII